MNFYYFLTLSLLFLVNAQKFPVDSYNDHFNCINVQGSGWQCCGYNALGEWHCAGQNDAWEEYEGTHRRCVKDWTGQYKKPSDLIGEKIDMCCDAPPYVNDCGKCKQFYVWPFKDYKAMNASATLDTDWRDQYLDQALTDEDGYDNEIFPAGFQRGTLREFNDPNVCVYVPYAAGKVIEIKVESEQYGDRLCIGDVHDETTNRNNPGQNDACGNTNVKTCFGDANLDGVGDDSIDELGFAFYLFCDEGCQEGGGSGDVPLWFRSRNSPTSWLNGTYDAGANVEMWCEYVVRDYPEYDVYPADVSIVVKPVTQPPDDSVARVSAVLFVLLGLWFY